MRISDWNSDVCSSDLPGLGDQGGTRTCGTLDLDDVQFGWFEEKLQGKKGAIDAALPTGKDFCLSLAEGDAIETRRVKRGGTSFDIDASTPQLNSLLGVVGSLLGNRSEERRVGKECVSTCRARWSP